MAKKAPPKPTPESRAVKAAIDASGLAQTAIADMIGVSPGMVSQWASGMRPVPSDKAPKFAKAVGQTDDPGKFSAAYRGVVAAQGGALPVNVTATSGDAREFGLVISRLENDIHALNLALGLLTGVMKEHRPAEAAAVASLIRRKVPPKYRDKGLLSELLGALEKPVR
jgi:transcriptional regulator with XRE-family HTH domain